MTSLPVLREYVVTDHRVRTSHDIGLCLSCGWYGEVGEGPDHAAEAGPVTMVEYCDGACDHSECRQAMFVRLLDDARRRYRRALDWLADS